QIDPAIALDDPRFDASISGTANVRTTVRDLLMRTPEAADYDIEGTVTLGPSTIRDVHFDRIRMAGQFRESNAQLTELTVTGPAIDARGSGRVPFAPNLPYEFEYDVSRADLAEIGRAAAAGKAGWTGGDLKGQLATTGRVT